MNINATLLGQMITFGVFIGFTMKYVWPPVMKALAERQKQIADGLEAADRGKQELVLSQEKAKEILRDARLQAAKIIEQAHLKASDVVDASKDKARAEGALLISQAKTEIAQEVQQSKDKLRKDVAQLAMKAAEKVLGAELNPQSHQVLLDKIIGEI